MIEFINSIPEFMWENIFTVINTLICGLIVAIFTSTFLKKKEERTRIAGVILEKRINSEQEVLHFLENELFKEEINIENSRKYDVVFSEVLNAYGLPNQYEGNIQYACIFTSFDIFNSIPLMVKRIPLPKGKELTDEEFKSVCNKVL